MCSKPMGSMSRTGQSALASMLAIRTTGDLNASTERIHDNTLFTSATITATLNTMACCTLMKVRTDLKLPVYGRGRNYVQSDFGAVALFQFPRSTKE